MRQPIRILIADDHTSFREGLEHILLADPVLAVIGTAASATETIERTLAELPDIVMLDLDMPGTGMMALKTLTARAISSRVLVLTRHRDYVVSALHAGASGYLLKDASSPQILEAIHTVAAGDVYLYPSILQQVVDGLRRGGEGLSDRDRAILRMVAEGSGNRAIGDALGLSEATIKQQVLAIRAKLGANDRTHAVALAKEMGLI